MRKRDRSPPKKKLEAAPDPDSVPSAAPEVKQPAPKQRKVGAKIKVANLLQTGGAYTVEQLQAATGGTEVTVKTALSDLRSAKYCGPSGVLNIVRADGKYSVNKEEAKS